MQTIFSSPSKYLSKLMLQDVSCLYKEHLQHHIANDYASIWPHLLGFSASKSPFLISLTHWHRPQLFNPLNFSIIFLKSLFQFATTLKAWCSKIHNDISRRYCWKKKFIFIAPTSLPSYLCTHYLFVFLYFWKRWTAFNNQVSITEPHISLHDNIRMVNMPQ